MDQNENANQEANFEAEDLLPEELNEEPQDESQSLEDAIAEDDTEQQQGEQPQSAGGQKEPGYVQGRINKAVEKALAQQREAFEAQMAPMREYMINQEAQELVRSGKVKDLETARELVRYRQGQPQPVQQAGQESGQVRDSQGRFASGNQQSGGDPAVQARINMLQHQANKIKTSSGIDVIAEFRNNEDVRMKVVSGEMDFYDVAEQLRGGGSRRAPSPVRSPNGASGSQKTAIDNMSDEQFERLEKRIKEGARYSLK